jgi:SAM-dependent methyltransferase
LEELAIWERWGGLSGGLVLDYGCGTGWLMQRLAQWGFKVLGLEVQREFLAEAGSRVRGLGALLVLYGGGALPLKKDSVDLVLAVGVVRSLMDRGPLGEAIEEWRRCLREGGRVLLIETDNAALRRKIRVQGIREALQDAGFEVLAWNPIRKTGWWGLSLVKTGLWPASLYGWMARRELGCRKRGGLGTRGKLAYLGEFRKGVG